MLFAGDTAGRISCWDVTALLLNHLKECCDLIEGELVTKISSSESRHDTDVAKFTTQDEKPGNKPSERRLFEENISSLTCDAAPASVSSCHVEENLTTVCSNKVKCLKSVVTKDGTVGRDAADCNLSNIEVQPTERTENEFQLHLEERILRKAADGKESTAVACETPIQSSVKEHQDNETFSSLCEEQSNFSCLPLVRIFLDPPSHVFQAHQSGVNVVSLTKTQGKPTQAIFRMDSI